MECAVSDEQLWSWFDRNAPELDEHLTHCPRCRSRAGQFRGIIDAVHAERKVCEHVIPETIGPYRIVRLIGEGGMGVVYEAEQQMPRRPVAIKVLKRRETVEEPLERRFEEEMQALARLRHAYIGTIYEAGETDDGLRYLAMELATGTPLDEYCRRNKLPERNRLALFVRICEAIEYAHRQNVIHHDLKPTNILIDQEGHPKIVDFGMARVITSEGTFAEQGGGPVIGGTPAYMSPERVRGTPEGDRPSSDVYSLGVVLYQILTGALPDDLGSDSGDSPCASNSAAQSSTIEPRKLSNDLLAVLRKAMARKPEQRYETVAALMRDVRRCAVGDVPLAREAGLLHIARRKLRRHHLPAAALVVLIMVAGAAVLRDWVRRDVRDPAEGRRLAMTIMLDLEEGRGVAAAAALPALVERYPDLPDTSLVYAQVKYWTQPYALDVTKGYLADQLQLDPEQWWCRLMQSEVYRAEAAQKQPEMLPRERTWEPSDSAEVWYLRSLATLDLDVRRACAREATVVDKSSMFALGRLARLQRATGRGEAALRGARDLIELGASEQEWVRFMGDTLMIMDQPNEAVAKYDRLIALGPELAEPYRLRGHALLLLGDVAQAHEAYAAAIARDSRPPRDPWLFFERALCRRILGDWSGSVADLTESRRLLGKPSRADAALFIMYLEAGQTDQARDVLGLANQYTDDLELQRIFGFLGNAIAAEVLIEGSRTPVERCAANYWVAVRAVVSGDRAAADQYLRESMEIDARFNPRRFPEPLTEWVLARWRLGVSEELAAEEPETE